MTNTEIVQKAYADFGRGDIEALLNALDEQIEWITPEVPEFPASGKGSGRAHVAEFFRVVGETWDFQNFEPREYVASGDRVVVLGTYTPRALKTGRTVTANWAMAWTFRNGKVIHFQEYTDSALLREALTGLAPARS
jgi:ketosteroid isomerase-like protein